MAPSCFSTAWFCVGSTSGFMKMLSSTPPRHCSVAFVTPCLSSNAKPTRVSDTTAVRMAATVISRLRRRLSAVSRVTRVTEMATD
jgi:hypothetical protein